MKPILLLLLSATLAHAQDAPIRVSGGVMAGRILYKPTPPRLPQAAIDQHINGAVVFHAIIGTDGHIKTLIYVAGPKIVAEALIDTVRKWTYKPYTLNDKPVAVDTTLTVSPQFGG